MERMEMVEKLREKANVGYEEAKEALEASDWDILDAMVILEKQGKVNPLVAVYTTKKEEPKDEENYDIPKNNAGVGEMIGKFFRWIGRLVQKGNQNSFIVNKGGENIITLPLTVCVLLLIFCFWAVIPIVIIGLFFGFEYSFSGPHLGRKNVNDVMGKATKVADNIKEEFKSKGDK